MSTHFEKMKAKAKRDVDRGMGDTRCTYVRAVKGLSYPRTCAKCGLGSCPYYKPDEPAKSEPGDTEGKVTSNAQLFLGFISGSLHNTKYQPVAVDPPNGTMTYRNTETGTEFSIDVRQTKGPK